MHAPPLRELQRYFWDAIASAPGELRASPELLRLVSPSTTLDPAGRLAIYADMYWHRLHDVLAEDFACTAQLLGADAFADVARAYLRCRPSEEPSIARVGEAFAAFLERHPPHGAPQYAAALAALEWARVAAFDTPDATPLALAQLLDLPPEAWPQLALVPAPSLTVHDLDWPVQRLLDPGFAGTIDETPTTVRVWRNGWLVCHASVDAVERPALRLLCAGATFGEIGAACSEPEIAAALLARWLEDGIVVRDDA
jgi:hypothetical protein